MNISLQFSTKASFSCLRLCCVCSADAAQCRMMQERVVAIEIHEEYDIVDALPGVDRIASTLADAQSQMAVDAIAAKRGGVCEEAGWQRAQAFL